MDFKHYRAKQLLRIIQDKKDLFPIWNLEDHECNGISFRCLVWEGPGRRIIWTPHALERFLERRRLDFSDDSELMSIQNQLKQISAQPWLHTFGVGEHSIILRSPLNVYTLVFIVQADQKVVVKTYIDSAKKSASRDFKVVGNMGGRMGKPEEGRRLADQDLWSEDRKQQWTSLWDNPPKILNKGEIRRWASEIADLSGDLEIAARALCHIITGFHHDNLMARIRVSFTEDRSANASWGVEVARYVENIPGKDREDVLSLAMDTMLAFLKLKPEQRSAYPLTYARFRGKVPMAMPAFEAACEESFSMPQVQQAFSDRTMMFRKFLSKWTTKGMTRVLGVSRSKVNSWYWHADEMPEDLWQKILTEPLPETHPCELDPVEK